MLVSIITSNYNCSNYISQAIESVRAQTFSDWEMLIIDDCSTDDSIKVISPYLVRDKRIKLLKTPLCSGSPAEPRNLGIRNARGKYIAFLDSDDIWLPKKLENQLKCFDTEKIALVFSNYEKISAEGLRNKRVILAPPSVNYKNLLKSNCIGCLTAIYDVSKAGETVFQHFHHEDYAFWLTILRKGYIARNTGAVEALYRVRTGSVSSKKGAALHWQWDIYRKYLHLSFISSLYYFGFYLVNGLVKYLK
jgi:glycosyltransferase involved in cell wall biosynthesis